MKKSAITTAKIMLTALCVALFAMQAWAQEELSQDEIDRIMSERAAPHREKLPEGMIYLDDGTPYIIPYNDEELKEEIPSGLSPEELKNRISVFESSFTPQWETPKPAIDETAIAQEAKIITPQKASIWTKYIVQTKVTEPLGVINSGVIIPAMLLTGLDSDLPGYLIAQVSEPVYDSPTGTELLIPQGSRLFGEYDSKVIFGQRRPLVKWSRLIFPDGSVLDMDNMPGADKKGYSGFKASVNNHYLPMFGNAVMLSVFAGLAQEYADDGTSITISQPRITLGDIEEVGTIKGWSTDTPPSGYLMCDGSEFDETTYSDLAELLGDNKTPDYNSSSANGIKWIIRATSISGSGSSFNLGSSTTVVDDDGNEIVSEIAETLSDMADRLLSKYLDMAPTLTVKPAYRFSVIVNRELLLPVKATL